MTDFILNAQPRTDEGKGASRRLRHAGFVPAVVYGGDKRKKPVSVSLENRVLVKQIEDPSFFSSILTLELEGKERSEDRRVGNDWDDWWQAIK